MAKQHNNDLTLGLSGRLGKQIGFRQVAGQTEAFRLPGKRTKAPTNNMEAQWRKFIKAMYYAKGVINDPVKKAVYQAKAKGRLSAYNLAMRDYMKPPVIEVLEFDNYAGRVGDKINIMAVDDFKVASVSVVIHGPNGVMIEQGEAVVQPSGVDWVYTATVANPQYENGKISVFVKDLAGNPVYKEEVI